jgi:hypothetical protein
MLELYFLGLGGRQSLHLKMKDEETLLANDKHKVIF